MRSGVMSLPNLLAQDVRRLGAWLQGDGTRRALELYIQFVCNEYNSNSLQKANKAVWICANGRLEHPLLMREG